MWVIGLLPLTLRLPAKRVSVPILVGGFGGSWFLRGNIMQVVLRFVDVDTSPANSWSENFRNWILFAFCTDTF